jgi:uncharacterized protein YjaZ
MNQNFLIHFLKTKQSLNQKMEKLLKETVEKYAEDACQILNISLVNIIIWPNPNAVISETGEGGETWSSEVCFVYIDQTRSEEELQNIITTQIPGTIYHELNHIARWNKLGKNIGFHTDLSKSIISEGLASVFHAEKCDNVNIPWTTYTQKEIVELLDIYQNRNQKLDMKYNHGEWFYGEGELPRWIGYKVGFYIVDAFRKKHPNVVWKELVGMNAEKIIKLSEVFVVEN